MAVRWEQLPALGLGQAQQLVPNGGLELSSVLEPVLKWALVRRMVQQQVQVQNLEPRRELGEALRLAGKLATRSMAALVLERMAKSALKRVSK